MKSFSDYTAAHRFYKEVYEYCEDKDGRLLRVLEYMGNACRISPVSSLSVGQLEILEASYESSEALGSGSYFLESTKGVCLENLVTREKFDDFEFLNLYMNDCIDYYVEPDFDELGTNLALFRDINSEVLSEMSEKLFEGFFYTVNEGHADKFRNDTLKVLELMNAIRKKEKNEEEKVKIYITSYGMSIIMGKRLEKSLEELESIKTYTKEENKKLDNAIKNFDNKILTVIALLIAAVAFIGVNITSIPNITEKFYMNILAINMSLLFVLTIMFTLIHKIAFDRDDGRLNNILLLVSFMFVIVLMLAAKDVGIF